MLRRRSRGKNSPVVATSFEADFTRQVEQNAIGNDRGVEASRFEFLRDVESRFVVFRRTRNMRVCSQRLQLLPGKFGVRDGEEFCVDLGLLCEVGVSKNTCLGLGIRIDGWERERQS